MASEFHYGYIFVALATACATPEAPRETIDLPAVSAPLDGKTNVIKTTKYSDQPEGVNVKTDGAETIPSSDPGNPKIKDIPSDYYQNLNSPNPKTNTYKWKWSSNSSSSSSN
jgi:hypothetical protein